MSDNVEFWLELANALMVLASIIFLAGVGLGMILATWLSRRAAAKRQKAWLKTLRDTDAERRRLLEGNPTGMPAYEDPAR